MDTQTAQSQQPSIPAVPAQNAPPIMPPQQGLPPLGQSAVQPHVQPVVPRPMQPPPAVKKPLPVWVIIVIVLLSIIGLYAGYIFGYVRRQNIVTVRNQPVADSVLIDKLVMGFPKGGFVVVQRKSAFPTGEHLGNSGLIPPGTYVNVGVDLAKQGSGIEYDPVESGDFLYIVLYANTDDNPVFSEGDVQLTDALGKYAIARFQVQ